MNFKKRVFSRSREIIYSNKTTRHEHFFIIKSKTYSLSHTAISEEAKIEKCFYANFISIYTRIHLQKQLLTILIKCYFRVDKSFYKKTMNKR